MLTIGSLFSGIGGLELGLERAGLGPVLWQAEVDPFCRRALAHHWPKAKRYPDVRSIRANRVDAPDLVCGGFPCQDISLAGSGRGLDGERSGLWREFARVVAELRPRVVVVENVAALRRRGLGDVLGDLAACGYDATWDCVPAAAVGAPHRRDRLFVVAWRVSDTERDEMRHEPERGQGGAQAADQGDTVARHVGEARRAALANADTWRREVERVASRQPGDAGAHRNIIDGCELPLWPPAPDDVHAWSSVPTSAQPALCSVAHELPDRLARLAALGNAVAPAVGEAIGRVVVAVTKEAA